MTETEMLIASFRLHKAYQEDHEKGFLLSSGQRSPFYVDCRVILAHWKARYLVATMIHKAMYADSRGGTAINSIGGLATGCIPIATTISDLATCYRTFYVRKAPKNHGTKLLIEGAWQEGDVTVIVDDVLTSGGSIKMACDVTGATRAFVIVDREEGGRENLKEWGIEVTSLLTLSDLKL